MVAAEDLHMPRVTYFVSETPKNLSTHPSETGGHNADESLHAVLGGTIGVTTTAGNDTWSRGDPMG